MSPIATTVPGMPSNTSAVSSCSFRPHAATSPAPTRVAVPALLATLTLAVPLFPSLVAVIVTDPAATPPTNPSDETLATEGLDEDHVMVRPVSTDPVASFRVAESCTDPPTTIAA